MDCINFVFLIFILKISFIYSQSQNNVYLQKDGIDKQMILSSELIDRSYDVISGNTTEFNSISSFF